MANTWVPTSAGQGIAFSVDYYGRFPYDTDPVDPDNPEVIGADDTEVALNYFGSGRHAIRKWSAGADGWRDIGAVWKRDAGALGGGQGAKFQVDWDIEFNQTALDEYSGFGLRSPLIQLTGVSYNAASFAKVMVWGARWDVTEWYFVIQWARFSNGSSQTFQSGIYTYGDLQFGTKRTMQLRVQCTSAHQTEFPVTPQDGSIELYLDGSLIASATGIDPFTNWASGNPGVLNQVDKVGLGFAGLMGPMWLRQVSDDFVTVGETLPTVDESVPCCTAEGGVGGGVAGAGVEDDFDFVPSHNPEFESGGAVAAGSGPPAGESLEVW